MLRITKKRLAVVAGVIAALAIAVSAYAYFTTSGTGSGSATVGTDAQVTVAVNSIATLYPGHDSAVSYTITNNSSDTGVNIDKLVADTSKGTNGISDMSPAGCDASWFTFADVPFSNLHLNEAGSPGDSTSSTAPLHMTDDAAQNQDACKNATFTLNLKIDDSGI